MGIQFVIAPLIIASVIRGIAAGGESENLSRLGSFALIFFVVSTLLAVVVGIAIVLLVQPGIFIDSDLIRQVTDRETEAVRNIATSSIPGLKELPEVVLGLFPKDPLTTFVSGNMLQTVISSLIIALALVALPAREKKPLLDLLASVQSVCMVIVGWVLRFVPIAVFGLLANISARIGIATLLATGVYVFTVLAGLLILLLIYLCIISFFSRTSPRYFLRNAREVMLLALSTSSSAAVMPLPLSTTEKSLAFAAALPASLSRWVPLSIWREPHSTRESPLYFSRRYFRST